MRVFFDTEFTGLCQDTTLMSIGIISEDGHTFYAESSTYNKHQVDEWIKANVEAHMRFTGEHSSNPALDLEHHAMKSEPWIIAAKLREWLAQWDRVEMWSDCYAYDWVLFCQLFGGALKIPGNVFYIPFDLATAFAMRDIDPDISRDEYAKMSDDRKHNALHDAKAIRACYLRLMEPAT